MCVAQPGSCKKKNFFKPGSSIPTPRLFKFVENGTPPCWFSPLKACPTDGASVNVRRRNEWVIVCQAPQAFLFLDHTSTLPLWGLCPSCSPRKLEWLPSPILPLQHPLRKALCCSPHISLDLPHPPSCAPLPSSHSTSHRRPWRFVVCCVVHLHPGPYKIQRASSLL